LATDKKLILKTDPRNARLHPPRNLEAVGRSLDELGAGRSIVVDRDGVVIGGNAVLEKAKELGLDMRVVHTKGDKLVVVVRDDLATDDPKRKALALADNQIALLAEWDESVLEEIQFEIEESDFDIDLDVMGFDLPVEIPEEDEGSVSELVDRAEELNKKWKVKRGQIWEIPSKATPGKSHRVMCGDSTDAGDVAVLMDGGKMRLCTTSPPYWVGREYEAENGKNAIISHINHEANCLASIMDIPGHIALNTGTTVATRHGENIRQVWLLLDWWANALGKNEWFLRNVRIWAKHGRFVPYTPKQDVVDLNWEFLASFSPVKIRSQNKIGERWALDGLWDIQPQTQSVNHSAPFPVEIPTRFIQLYTNKGDTVYDPYLGSGTTVVAAEQEGRICYGMEICEEYVSVVLERLSVLGLEPRLTA